MLYLPKNLGPLPQLAGTDAVRVLDEGGTYRVWTWTGRTMVIIRGETCKDQQWEHLDTAPNGKPEAAVCGRRWKQIFGLPKKNVCEAVGLVAADDVVTLCTLVGQIKGTWSLEHAETTDWPTVADCLPLSQPVSRTRVGVDELAKILQLVKKLGCEEVTLLHYGPGQVLGLVAQNGKLQQYFDALILPAEEPTDA